MVNLGRNKEGKIEEHLNFASHSFMPLRREAPILMRKKEQAI